MSELRAKLVSEALRIEEDCEHSAKSHYNTADRWGCHHLLIGVISATLAAIATGVAFGGLLKLAGTFAILSTAFTTVLTFLKPSERAETHKAAAGQYLALRNQTRLFRELELAEEGNLNSAKCRLIDLSDSRDRLNQTSPGIPRRDYEKAKADIDEARTQYRVDQRDK